MDFLNAFGPVDALTAEGRERIGGLALRSQRLSFRGTVGDLAGRGGDGIHRQRRGDGAQ